MTPVRRRVLGWVLAVLAPVVVVPPSTAEAAPDDIIAVVIDGVGFGHGRGMSQWGAYGWAVDQGKSWQWILDHYYGGTTLGDVTAGQRIKVRLLAVDGLGTVGLLSHGAGVSWNGQTRTSMRAVEISPGTFDVYGTSSVACPTGSTVTVPSGSPSIAQGSSNSSGVTQIQTFLKAYHDSAIAIDGQFGPQTNSILRSWQTAQGLTVDGVWHPEDAARANLQIAAGAGSVSWTKLGTQSGTLRFTTPTGEDSATAPASVLGVCTGSGSVTHYRGAIEVSSQSDGNRVVNDVKVEDYLRGVVPKEISASWATAGGGAGANAVRAQAVAARSYGLQQNRYSYATTCDSQSCQVYGGSATRSVATGAAVLVEDWRTDQAVAATAGKVRLWSNGSIVSTEFSASNGPRTAGGVFTPVDDAPGDGVANNPNHRWTRVLDADTLEATFGLGQLLDASMVEAASSTYQQFDGIWFNDIVLTGTAGTRRMQAWDFRGQFGLLSPGFTVRVIRESSVPTTFALIGDSVGNSIAHTGASELRILTDQSFASATFDVVDGRCTTKASCPGTTGVEVANSLPAGLDLVVVELGYNDWSGTFAADVQAMMNALDARGVRQVLWVNMADIRTSGGASVYAPMNAVLAAAAAQRPNMTVLDWNAASAHSEARARWFSDGVHLTTTGQAEFALWLRGQLLGAAPSHWLAPPKRIVLPVVGRTMTDTNGQPVTVPADATSVALTITAFKPTGHGFVTAWPCNAPQPLASNLNYAPGDVIANNVMAPVAPDGTVCLYSAAGTHLIVDVAGWFSAGSGAAKGLTSVTPTRVVDTRVDLGRAARVTPGDPLVLTIPGMQANTPAGATITAPTTVDAVSLNVVAVGPSAHGFLTVWPCAEPFPLAATVTYAPGEIAGNGTLAAVDANGQVCVHSHASTDVVVDVQGWFDGGGSAATFTAGTPVRLLDTRNGTGAPVGRVSRDRPVTLPVRGRTILVDGVPTAVPASASAVVVDVAVFQPDGHGFVTVWPCVGSKPLAANLVYGPGTVRSNGVVAPVGPDGTICLYTESTADLIVDLSGWLSAPSDGGFHGVVPNRLVDTRDGTGPIPV